MVEMVYCDDLSAHNWEKILLCTRKEEKLEGKESLIFEDFKLLNFLCVLSEDPSDFINYNEGKEANPFDKISKYYGRKKDVFLFISVLRNEEYFKKITSVLTSKCGEPIVSKFIQRAKLYLEQVKKGENYAKEILGSERFIGAFYRGYPDNRFQNLNINFVDSSQCINITNIFNKNWITNEVNNKTERIKIYDQGQRVATVCKDSNGKLNFSLNQSCSCQLILNRVFEAENYTFSIDLNSHQVIYVTLKIGEENVEPQRVLNLPWNTEIVFINRIPLIYLLRSYFDAISSGQLTISNQDECSPVKTLEDLRAWCPLWNKPISQKLAKRKPDENLPKTLVCHDMKGGYLEDRFVNGALCENPYFFVHWSGIDTFVYFSHHLVTIPPCTWISAAHINGVKILGTFITEWNEGDKICKQIFANENSVIQLCNQLVKIALHYNFDGWLINIENPIMPCQIPLMIKFVKFLTERMHAASPGSQVIWYDSVIKSGELRWQNALNKLNRMFFHVCDGIFLNYNWDEKSLLESLSEAGSRKNDVYVGVDVFGRGCLGGGGFSTNIAVAEARRFGLSVAIFAPGWVYECLEAKDFKENQFKFWRALESYLPPTSVEELPYRSSFCPGFGNKMYREGEVISEKPWYNLSLQQPQPLFSLPPSGSVSLYTEEALSGGGCLLLEGKFVDVSEPLKYKILKTHFKMEEVGQINLAFKCLSTDVKVDLVLTVLNESRKFYLSLDSVKGNMQEINEYSENSKTQSFGRTQKLNYDVGIWNERKFIHTFGLLGCGWIEEVTVNLTPINEVKQAQVLIGKLEILPAENFSFEYKDLSLNHDVKSAVIEVQCTLFWKFNSQVICDLYSVLENGKKSYICTSSQQTLNLKTSVDDKFKELELLICPQNIRNGEFKSLSLKIPLNPTAKA